MFFFFCYQPTLDVHTAQIAESWGFNHFGIDPTPFSGFWIGLVDDNLTTKHNNKGESQGFYSEQSGLYEIKMDFNPGMPDVATYILTSGWFSTRDIVVSVSFWTPQELVHPKEPNHHEASPVEFLRSEGGCFAMFQFRKRRGKI